MVSNPSYQISYKAGNVHYEEPLIVELGHATHVVGFLFSLPFCCFSKSVRFFPRTFPLFCAAYGVATILFSIRKSSRIDYVHRIANTILDRLRRKKLFWAISHRRCSPLSRRKAFWSGVRDILVPARFSAAIVKGQKGDYNIHELLECQNTATCCRCHCNTLWTSLTTRLCRSKGDAQLTFMSTQRLLFMFSEFQVSTPRMLAHWHTCMSRTCSTVSDHVYFILFVRTWHFLCCGICSSIFFSSIMLLVDKNSPTASWNTARKVFPHLTRLGFCVVGLGGTSEHAHKCPGQPDGPNLKCSY